VDTSTTARVPYPAPSAAAAGDVDPGVLDASAAAAPVPVPPVPRPAWLVTYVALLVAVDALAIAAATLIARASWLDLSEGDIHIRSLTIPYGALTVLTVPTWLIILALAGAYDVGPFGSTRHWTSIVRAAAQLLAVVAVAYYVLHLALLGRGVLVAVVPLGVALTVAARAVVGAVFNKARRQGRARRTALVAGSRRGIDAVLAQLADHPAAGITPVGQVPVEGPAADPTPAITAALAQSGAEALIVTGGLARGSLRDIAWRLEGTGVELLVVPAPGELGSLSSQIRPVAGLPLVYIG